MGLFTKINIKKLRYQTPGCVRPGYLIQWNHMVEARIPEWDIFYKETDVTTMPWYHKELDDDLESALAERGIITGSFLDLGTGAGTQAAALAKLGFKVTGTDISFHAVLSAKNASTRAQFLQDDILSTKLVQKFDYVFDRGCFHVIPPKDRWKYVLKVSALLEPGGTLFLKCFSIREARVTDGPFRFSEEQIEEIFRDEFEVEQSKQTIYQGTLTPFPKALFVVLRKI